ncbi:hypothetical protein [Bacteroides pyogenes]|nr:hypothetical protein [Bacteroides pyogenes]
MKQYVDYKKGKKQKGSAFPSHYTLNQAVGALTLHTGVGTNIAK